MYVNKILSIISTAKILNSIFQFCQYASNCANYKYVGVQRIQRNKLLSADEDLEMWIHVDFKIILSRKKNKIKLQFVETLNLKIKINANVIKLKLNLIIYIDSK